MVLSNTGAKVQWIILRKHLLMLCISKTFIVARRHQVVNVTVFLHFSTHFVSSWTNRNQLADQRERHSSYDILANRICCARTTVESIICNLSHRIIQLTKASTHKYISDSQLQWFKDILESANILKITYCLCWQRAVTVLIICQIVNRYSYC